MSRSAEAVMGMVRTELALAEEKWGDSARLNSAHEGYAVILEELDELWEQVKANRGYSSEAMVEAVQVAAMAVRYVMDFGGDPDA